MEDLTNIAAPTSIQWDDINAEIDLVLLALEALTGIGSEAMLSAAINLNLESRVPDRWRYGDCANLTPYVKVKEAEKN